MPEKKNLDALRKQNDEMLEELAKDFDLEVHKEEGPFATRSSGSSEFATAAFTTPQEEKTYRGQLQHKVHYHAKDILKQIFSLKRDTADYDTIRTRISEGGMVTGTNLAILLCAIVIASVGLNMNSTAVIIGAMLISPLMGTIQLMGLSIATADAQKFKKAIIGFSFQVLTALLGSTIYFALTPIKTVTSELLARTSPTVWDVLIATAGGLAGAIATTRKDATSNVIPGVAIATALMPPLCTCGYSVATAHWNMLGGAAFLFTINAFFILVANVLVLYILEVPEVSDAKEETKSRMRKALIRNGIIILIPSIILAAYVTKQTNTQEAADSAPVTPRTVSTAEVTDQLKILFPEIAHVQVGQIEETDASGTTQKKNIMVLTLKEELAEEDQERLEQWIYRVYDDSYIIQYELQEVPAA